MASRFRMPEHPPSRQIHRPLTGIKTITCRFACSNSPCAPRACQAASVGDDAQRGCSGRHRQTGGHPAAAKWSFSVAQSVQQRVLTPPSISIIVLLTMCMNGEASTRLPGKRHVASTVRLRPLGSCHEHQARGAYLQGGGCAGRRVPGRSQDMFWKDALEIARACLHCILKLSDPARSHAAAQVRPGRIVPH